MYFAENCVSLCRQNQACFNALAIRVAPFVPQASETKETVIPEAEIIGLLFTACMLPFVKAIGIASNDTDGNPLLSIHKLYASQV
jgi:hypothetical protein